jgi:NAD(P)-dependent dehydrogenase (short-subunit alcohol dehydrogenase family)
MAIRSFRGKTAVVTGAASGIGRATALAFAREGANVAAADLDKAALGILQAEVEGHGVSCLAHRLDVSDEAAVAAFAGVVQEAFGAPHVVVNNAGVGYLGLFLKGDLAHWKRVLDVNVMGVVHGCRHFLPAMVEAGGPRHVLNLASSAGNVAVPSMAAYSASKYAVVGFSEVLKMELSGTDVRVTTVCPGVINTPIVNLKGNVAASVPEDQIARLQAYYKRVGCSPDVVAADMLKAVREDRDLVLTGPSARLVYHLRRVSQRLVRSVMLRFAHESGYFE